MEYKFIIKKILSWIGWIQYFGGKKGVYLTFDDGPDPMNNPKILGILERYSAKGTFFVNGSLAEKYPEIIQHIINKGHSIGSHLFSHRSVKKMTSSEWKEEENKTEEAIYNATGKKVNMVRPPYGEMTLWFIVNMWFHNKKIVLWSIDSYDSKIEDCSKLIHILMNSNICNGSIILLHEDYCHTVDALPRLIEHIQSKGYSIMAL